MNGKRLISTIDGGIWETRKKNWVLIGLNEQTKRTLLSTWRPQLKSQDLKSHRYHKVSQTFQIVSQSHCLTKSHKVSKSHETAHFTFALLNTTPLYIQTIDEQANTYLGRYQDLLEGGLNIKSSHHSVIILNPCGVGSSTKYMLVPKSKRCKNGQYQRKEPTGCCHWSFVITRSCARYKNHMLFWFHS